MLDKLLETEPNVKLVGCFCSFTLSFPFVNQKSISDDTTESVGVATLTLLDEEQLKKRMDSVKMNKLFIVLCVIVVFLFKIYFDII